MYLGITPLSMKDISDTENCVVMLKKTGDAGWAMREVSNKYTNATNHSGLFILMCSIGG